MSTPSEIAERAARSAETYLEQPHPELQGLQDAAKAAEGTLGAAGVRSLLANLQGAEKTLREQRLKQLLDEMTRAFAPLGLKIEGRVLRRKPRKRGAKPATPQEAEQASAAGEGTTSERSGDAQPAELPAALSITERRGFLGRKAQ